MRSAGAMREVFFAYELFPRYVGYARNVAEYFPKGNQVLRAPAPLRARCSAWACVCDALSRYQILNGFKCLACERARVCRRFLNPSARSRR